jgi:tRNA G18 (ribose-2'-O)-methylase SpoU
MDVGKKSNIIEISDFRAPELDPYARLNERELNAFMGKAGGIFIAESPNVISRALDAGYEPISLLMERRHIEGQAAGIVERCGGVPLYTAEPGLLAGLTGFRLTRGVLCAMRRRPLPSAEDICRGAARIAVLECVMNPTNLGAIFRSAAALNMDAVLLTPGCADPLYRRAARVSMGTVFQIPWTYLGETPEDWPDPGMERLKDMGFRTAAMALRGDSVSLCERALNAEKKLAIVLGSEGDGLSDRTIAECDYCVRIPMSHGVDSLNVAAASAVAFWQLACRE